MKDEFGHEEGCYGGCDDSPTPGVREVTIFTALTLCGMLWGAFCGYHVGHSKGRAYESSQWVQREARRDEAARKATPRRDGGESIWTLPNGLWVPRRTRDVRPDPYVPPVVVPVPAAPSHYTVGGPCVTPMSY